MIQVNVVGRKFFNFEGKDNNSKVVLPPPKKKEQKKTWIFFYSQHYINHTHETTIINMLRIIGCMHATMVEL